MSSTEDLTSVSDDIFNRNDMWTQNFVIVSEIFKYLSWKDMRNAEKVCQLWYQVAGVVRPKFSPAKTFYSVAYQQDERFHFEMDSETTLEPYMTLCFHDTDLTFISWTCDQLVSPICDEYCLKSHSVLEYVEAKTSGEKSMIFLVSIPGALYCSPSHDESIFGHMYGLSGFTLPNIENVEIHIHSLRDADSEDEELREDLFNIEFHEMLDNYTVKCLIAFITDSDVSFVGDLVNRIYERQPKCLLAFGGCRVDDLSDEHGEFHQTHIIAFAVKKTVKEVPFDCHSIVLDGESQQEIDEKFTKLSKSMPKREHSLAIQFGCFYNDQLEYCQQFAFTKQFPTTPIVGCDTINTLGMSSILEDRLEFLKNEELRASCGLNSPSCLYEQSSVMIMLNWGSIA